MATHHSETPEKNGQGMKLIVCRGYKGGDSYFILNDKSHSNVGPI
jgi:hypothetical protein